MGAPCLFEWAPVLAALHAPRWSVGAVRSSTRTLASPWMSIEDNSASQEPDMNLLSRRIESLRNSAVHTLVYKHPLLPRQRIKVTVSPEFAAVCSVNKTIGVLSRQTSTDGISQGVLSHGVEATVESVDGSTVGLVGGSLIALCDDSDVDSGVHSDDIHEHVVRKLNLSFADELSSSVSTSRAATMASRELGTLVSTLFMLAELTIFHLPLERLRHELGAMPPVECASERALWVVALLNPTKMLPDLPDGRPLATDVRANILTADKPIERISIARAALIDAIYKIQGGQWPQNTYYH